MKAAKIAEANEILRKLDVMLDERIADIHAEKEIRKMRQMPDFQQFGLAIATMRLYQQYVKEARFLIGSGSPNDDFHPEVE